MARLIGLRHTVCANDDWYYLVFYDIDNRSELYAHELAFIDNTMSTYGISYIVYKTKHGFHILGLTPVTATEWANVFTSLKGLFNSYYSGNVLRLSRKENEVQQLISIKKDYGYIIPNLYNLFAQRFNYPKLPWIKETSKYLLVFEKYRSLNE